MKFRLKINKTIEIEPDDAYLIDTLEGMAVEKPVLENASKEELQDALRDMLAEDPESAGLDLGEEITELDWEIEPI